MTKNFEAARRTRRSIVRLLTQQQAADAECAKKLKTTILLMTKDVLEINSTLLSYDPANQLSADTQSLFEKISPNVSCSRWRELQAEEETATNRLAELTTQLERAEREYNALAPWRQLSAWLTDESQKAAIERAKRRRDTLREDKLTANSTLIIKKSEVQAAAEQFLRDSMKPESLAKLMQDSPIQQQLSETMKRFSDSIKKIWEGHKQAQLNSLAQVSTKCNELLMSYNYNSDLVPALIIGDK